MKSCAFLLSFFLIDTQLQEKDEPDWDFFGEKFIFPFFLMCFSLSPWFLPMEKTVLISRSNFLLAMNIDIFRQSASF